MELEKPYNDNDSDELKVKRLRLSGSRRMLFDIYSVYGISPEERKAVHNKINIEVRNTEARCRRQ